jgi:hypothetical protein
MITIDDQTDYSEEVENIDIIEVRYEKQYKLYLQFADGTAHTVDFEPFLRQARNPMTTKYLDVGLFQQFTLEHGNLHWNNDEMCFRTDYLYDHDVVEYHGFG